MPKQELQECLTDIAREYLEKYPRFRCLGEQILIKRIEDADELTRGGIVKPEIARPKPNRGIVMAIGEGRMVGDKFMPFTLHIGDKVLFARHGGTDVELDGEPFILLHWKQVYLVENHGQNSDAA